VRGCIGLETAAHHIDIHGEAEIDLVGELHSFSFFLFLLAWRILHGVQKGSAHLPSALTKGSLGVESEIGHKVASIGGKVYGITRIERVLRPRLT
jgi:hypothetical protein